MTPLRMPGASRVSPRLGKSGWPSQHNPLLDGQRHAEPAGVFWEGEGYDFVLFIANHGSPPNGGKAAGAAGRLLLHGAALPRREALQTTPFPGQAAPYARQHRGMGCRRTRSSQISSPLPRSLK